MHEVRQVHSLAMSPVWQVAPHPDATDREGPGMFREHDIRPFGAGMTPPSWPLVPARVQDWIDEANAAATGRNPRRRRRSAPRDPRPAARRLREGPPLHRRERPYRPPAAEPVPGEARLSAGHRAQTAAAWPTLPPCSEPTAATTGRWGKSWPAPCTTTSTVSSFRPWRDRRGWFRCPLWSIRTCHWLPCGRPHSGGVSMPSRARTACGAALVRQWRSTGARGSADAQPKLVASLAAPDRA